MKDLVYHRSLLPAATRFADRPAIIDPGYTADGGYTATYAEHVDRVLRLASGMGRELNLGRGDRFAVLALNSHEYVELYHAGFLGAGMINPLNLRLAPKELEYILSNSGSKVVFVDAPFAHLVERVREAAGVEKVILMGSGDVAHDATVEDLIAAGDPDIPPEPDEDDAVILMYTGGTTGLPKGVVLDNRAAMLNMYKVAALVHIDEREVFLHQTPMFHAASFAGIFGIPATGGTSTIIGMFDPGPVLDIIQRDRVTITVMVPTMLQMVLDHPAFRPERLASLDKLVYGASPMPAPLLDRLLGLSPDLEIIQVYGMTECCGVLTSLGPEDHKAGGDLLRSAGRPVVGSAVAIHDAGGAVLPVGESGEVCARAGNFMRKYWKLPDQTEAAFTGDWYHTGDAGYLDEKGYLYLIDRVKDMIVTGGENVYSAEVENAVAAFPGVAEVAVIGIPSEKWGESVHAIVVPVAGETLDEEAVKAWCRERIAAYKVPKSFTFRAEPLPLSGALKVLKRQLRAPFWEGRDRSVG